MTTQTFNKILDTEEKIIWEGGPSFWPFISTGFLFLLFGIIWGAFDFAFFTGFRQALKSGSTNFSYGVIIFLIFHSAPFRLSIFNMIRLYFIFPNTAYCYTNKRVIIRGGFRGIDYKSIDFDKIQNIEVNVNPIENMLNVGTIKIFSGETTSKGRDISSNFIGIKDPYEVFKNIKKVSLDIKADINYPNDLRPETNKGYKTTYNHTETTKK